MIRPWTKLITALVSLGLGATALRAETSVLAEPTAEPLSVGVVTEEALAALANEVNLPAWTQIAPAKDFAAIEETWASVYSPKDAVGQARNWGTQVKQARSLVVRATQAEQKRWLTLFIQAGEAIGRKDAVQFGTALRALKNDAPAARTALAANQNFFRAK